MKARYLFVLIVIILGLKSYSQIPNNSQISGTWLCNLRFNEMMGPFTTNLTFNPSGDASFTAASAENADIRIFGRTKARLARLFGKSPKKGIFLRIIEGIIIHQEGYDSISGKILIPMLGILYLKGYIKNDTLISEIIDSTEVIGTMAGSKNEQREVLPFKILATNIIDTTTRYIFNPTYVHGRKWKKFEKKLNKLATRCQDDVEFFFGFNFTAPKLPFSHYNLFLFPENPASEPGDTTHFVFLKKINDKTAYMNITSFGGSAEEMDSIFRLVLDGNYENLVIDLRENPGGGITSAIPFGQYLTPEKLNAGIFLTNKWFAHHPGEPFPQDYAAIPVTNSETTGDFIEELKTTEGQRLVIEPSKETFKGKIYVLISHKTASTCEPIVYTLKKHRIATIVGETTAGAMLSAAPIQVQGKYYLFMPIADYYTPDGTRLDQEGVKPDIKIEANDALNYVMGHLIGLQ